MTLHIFQRSDGSYLVNLFLSIYVLMPQEQIHFKTSKSCHNNKMAAEYKYGNDYLRM